MKLQGRLVCLALLMVAQLLQGCATTSKTGKGKGSKKRPKPAAAEVQSSKPGKPSTPQTQPAAKAAPVAQAAQPTGKVVAAPVATAKLPATLPAQSVAALANPSPAPQCKASDPASKQKLIDEARMAFYSAAGEERFRGGKRYDFSFIDMSVRDALLELSTASKIPIVFDENVSAQVSIEISNKTFLETLDMIASVGPYDYRYNGEFFYFGTLDSKQDSWRKLSYAFRYKARNISPTVLAKLIPAHFREHIQADDNLGILSIVAPRSIIMGALRVLVELDESPRQILLRLAITEISDKGIERLGRFMQDSTAFGAANALAPVAPAFKSAVLTKETFGDFLRSIEMLSRQGKADIRAQPKIIVLDGEKASFNSKISTAWRGERVYATRPSFIETGVSLSLIPNIVEGEEVLLKIDNARSGDFDVLDQGQVNEHSISTKVRVKQGESLVLGGMINKKKKLVTSKVPWLGDIPVLGWLFRSESEQEETIEIVFVITPEIVCR